MLTHRVTSRHAGPVATALTVVGLVAVVAVFAMGLAAWSAGIDRLDDASAAARVIAPRPSPMSLW